MNVVEDEGSGNVIAYIKFGTKKTITGRHGEIKHVFVDQEHRGKGIAKKLITYAEKELKKSGINKVRTVVTKSNHSSMEMNKRLGYKEKRIIFEKEL